MCHTGSPSEQQQGCRQLGGGPATTLPASLLAAGIISAAQPDAQETNSNPAALQVSSSHRGCRDRLCDPYKLMLGVLFGRHRIFTAAALSLCS
jgi:hypothetical protein